MKKLPIEEAAQVPGGVMAPQPDEIPETEYPQLPGGCTNPPTN